MNENNQSDVARSETIMITMVLAFIFLFFGWAGLQRIDRNYNNFILMLSHEQENKFVMIEKASTDIAVLNNQIKALNKKILKLEGLCSQKENYSAKPQTGRNLGFIYSAQ